MQDDSQLLAAMDYPQDLFRGLTGWVQSGAFCFNAIGVVPSITTSVALGAGRPVVAIWTWIVCSIDVFCSHGERSRRTVTIGCSSSYALYAPCRPEPTRSSALVLSVKLSSAMPLAVSIMISLSWAASG